MELEKTDIVSINVKEFGLEPAVRAIQAAGGGELFFPAGTYELTGKKPGATILSFRNIENLILTGEPNSILRLKSNGGFGQVRMLDVRDTKSLSISNLMFDGNKNDFQYIKQEQQSNIFIRRVERIMIHNILSVDAVGDAVNLGGSNDVVIRNSRFDGSRRNGITIGRGATKNLTILRNRFGSGIDTQVIDFEHGESENVKIMDNVFDKLLPVDNVTRDQFAITLTKARNAEISNNTINNPILIRMSQGVLLSQNNTISQLTIDGNSADVTVRSNSFSLQPTWRRANNNIAGILLKTVRGRCPENISFMGNNIYAQDISRIFQIKSQGHLVIENNTLNTNSRDELTVFLDQSIDQSTLRITANTINEKELEFARERMPGFCW